MTWSGYPTLCIWCTGWWPLYGPLLFSIALHKYLPFVLKSSQFTSSTPTRSCRKVCIWRGRDWGGEQLWRLRYNVFRAFSTTHYSITQIQQLNLVCLHKPNGKSLPCAIQQRIAEDHIGINFQPQSIRDTNNRDLGFIQAAHMTRTFACHSSNRNRSVTSSNISDIRIIHRLHNTLLRMF